MSSKVHFPASQPSTGGGGSSGSGDSTSRFVHEFTTTVLAPAESAAIPLQVSGTSPSWAAVTDIEPGDHSAVRLNPGIYVASFSLTLFNVETASDFISGLVENNGNINTVPTPYSFYGNASSLPNDGDTGDVFLIFDRTVIVDDSDANPFLLWLSAKSELGCSVSGHLQVIKVG